MSVADKKSGKSFATRGNSIFIPIMEKERQCGWRVEI